MSRKKKSDTLENDEPILDISSLIDVCFLLLIYFIVTTTISAREQDLSMAIPTDGSGGAPPLIPPMFIKVDALNRVYLNSGPSQEQIEDASAGRNLSQLDQRLNDYAATTSAGGQEPVVQIYVDSEAKQQRLVDVLNSLAGANIGQITFTDLIE